MNPTGIRAGSLRRDISPLWRPNHGTGLRKDVEGWGSGLNHTAPNGVQRIITGGDHLTAGLLSVQRPIAVGRLGGLEKKAAQKTNHCLLGRSYLQAPPVIAILP